MSRLDELIQKLYPDGVESKNLEECCTVLDRKRKPVTKAARENGEYPYYGANGIQDYVSDYIFDGTFVLVGEDGSVITSQGTPVVNWAEGKIWVNNHAHIIEEKNGVLLRYLYHYLQTVDVTHLIHGNIPKLTGGDFKALTVPVPPLEVQREIVRILDSFTLLTAELTAELTARKSQYEFYRDDLLTFSNEVEFKSFGELFDVRNGLNKGKEFFGHGSPIINFTDVYNNRWLAKDSFAGTVEVTPDEIERYGAKKGDIFFTRTSETKEDIGMASTLIEDVEDCVFSGFVLRARPKTDLLLPKFCAYYFSSTTVRNTIVRYASFTTRATTTGEKLSKILVPILPKDKQEKIVYVLDNFDAICSDLNIGLPAEIEARQKQYKYYRDALLTYAATGKIIRQTDRQTDRQLSVLR